MQVLSKSLIGKPVLSLRTGGSVALITRAIINPNNLHLEGFYCQDSIDKKVLVLLAQDVRDIIPKGLIVNDHGVLSEPEDLIRLKDIMNLNFELIGKPVITDSKKRLGKVSDFSTDVASLYIQKLYATQSVFRGLASGNLGIDRSQIIEITNRRIVIQDPVQLRKVPAASPVTAS